MSGSQTGAPRRFSTAAILSTGSEILQGLYADTNARYLAEQLSQIGLEPVVTIAAPDDEQSVEEALRFATARADVVLCTGGLGPTEDDVNRDAFERVLGVRLERNEAAIAMMRERFRRRGRGEMPPSNEVQALVPAGATVFQNEWGTAPGFFWDGGNKAKGGRASLIALPGPPKEMIPMFQKCALPLLRERVAGSFFVRTRTIHTIGRPESDLNEKTRELFRRDPDVKFTILAKGYGVDFRITARGASMKEVGRRIAEYQGEVTNRVGAQDIYGMDDDTLAEVVAKLLIAKGLTVCAAESCTGGLLTKMLTDTPGSSAFLKESHVTYSNEAKQKILGVQSATLGEFGAVSEQTCREMCYGARTVSGAILGVAVTGIAGPDGGSPDKPVGLTYVGLSTSRGVHVEQFNFLGDREQNRVSAALAALNLLRRALLEFI